jgi:hypothetical protein
VSCSAVATGFGQKYNSLPVWTSFFGSLRSIHCSLDALSTTQLDSADQHNPLAASNDVINSPSLFVAASETTSTGHAFQTYQLTNGRPSWTAGFGIKGSNFSEPASIIIQHSSQGEIRKKKQPALRPQDKIRKTETSPAAWSFEE